MEKVNNGILDRLKRNGNTAQLWTVEYDEGEDKLAFQNVSDGSYLVCTKGGQWGTVSTSSEKQWWKLEPGTTPGAYWYDCEEPMVWYAADLMKGSKTFIGTIRISATTKDVR